MEIVATAIASTVVTGYFEVNFVTGSNLRLSQWIPNTTKADRADATIDSSNYGIRPGAVPASFPTVELI